MDLPLRTRVAALAGRAASQVSRGFGTGDGSVIGGRVTLALDPRALETLARGQRTALVTGTNGKTTTTRLLAAALGTHGPVTTNSAGANLLAGLVGSLASRVPDSSAAMEVDEALLAAAVEATGPAVVVLLNLSRDQLDRIGEVRVHAGHWRHAFASGAGRQVRLIANADDPLVAWAAGSASAITWVGTGQQWRADAATCPQCGSRIEWPGAGPEWACSSCDLARPQPGVWLDGEMLVTAEGGRLPVALRLPGWCNRANATMAAAAASAFGVEFAESLAAMEAVDEVAGRYEVVSVGGSKVRLLLAKNPSGWAETLGLIRPAPVPVVVGINARVADGRDPSWLWDVPFEKLRGRLVVATGDRGRDLAVRLHYAEVDHQFVAGYRAAVHAAAGAAGGTPSAPNVDLAANYTSFQDARAAMLHAS